MILLRHGQSEFNLRQAATRVNPGIVDARLTEYGLHQAEAVAARLAREPIRRIIASPYTRALQTAAPLARLLGLKVEIRAIVRERFDLVSDLGTSRSRLRTAWPDHDFSRIDEIWWPDEYESPTAVTARATAFRTEMAREPDWPETLVVSHWGFILCMTGQNIANGQILRHDPNGPMPEQTIWR